MNLKRVRKRDLCSLIRFLNFYYLNQDRIHYFSIRVKEELIKDLQKMYVIAVRPNQVVFTSKLPPIPSFTYADNKWYREGARVELPRSRKECVRRLEIKRGQVTLTFSSS
jgi:hypothetical protein